MRSPDKLEIGEDKLIAQKGPFSIRMPEDIDAIALCPNDRTEWLRDAIFEKLWREGNLPEQYHRLISDSSNP